MIFPLYNFLNNERYNFLVKYEGCQLQLLMIQNFEKVLHLKDG